MNGWVMLHRSLLEWEWYQDANCLRLFIHCVLKANHKDKKHKGELIKRGSFVTGRQLLASETGLSVQSVRTSLSKLSSTKELTIKSTSKGTLVTVVKYEDFQKQEKESTSESTSELTNDQPTSNQRSTTNNNDNNEKKETINTKSYSLPFSSPEFKQAWDEWQQHRKEIRKKLTPSTIKKQLNQLSKINESDAIYTINLSIQNGWTGLFPEKLSVNGSGRMGKTNIGGTRDKPRAGEGIDVPEL